MRTAAGNCDDLVAVSSASIPDYLLRHPIYV
jgi:hypothetical protein